MIVKKKGLYLGLLLSLLGMGNMMQGKYTITIKNSTPHPVKFKLSFSRSGIYALQCWSNTKKLKAGRIARINVKSCPMKGLEATVQRSGQSVVKATPYNLHYGRTSSSTFNISGTDETGYKVTKVRNI